MRNEFHVGDKLHFAGRIFSIVEILPFNVSRNYFVVKDLQSNLILRLLLSIGDKDV